MIDFMFIFDIDGVLADSSHRQNTLPDGTLDLDNWRKQSTPEKIAKDKPLLYAKYAKLLHKLGFTVKISTARVMSNEDYKWIKKYVGIDKHHIFSRPQGCFDMDSELKRNHFKVLSRQKNYDKMRFYDDNIHNIRMAKTLGIKAKLVN